MNNFLNELDNYIMIISKDGKIEFCNEILLSKLKYTTEEILDKDIKNIINLNNIKEICTEEKRYKLISKEKEIINLSGKSYIQEFNSKESIYIIFKEIDIKENILKNTLDLLPFMVWIKDLDGKYQYINETFASGIAANKEDAIGKIASDYFQKENIEYFNKSDEEIIKSKSVHFNEEYIIINNEKRWYETYKVPIIDYNGEVKYTAGFSKDITLTKNLESQVKNSQYKLTKIDNIIDNDDEVISQLLINIKNDLISYLKADGASIWLYDYKKEKLCPCLKIGISNELLKDIGDINVDPKTLNDSVKSKEFEGIKSIDDIEGLMNREEAKKNNIKYGGRYKIEFNGQILGIMSTSYKELLSSKEVQNDFIRAICNQIAILIKNNNLSEKLKKEFKNREILESELKCFLETAADLMAIIDEDSIMKKVNGRWFDILGWEEDELLNKSYREVIYKEDVEDITNKTQLIKKLKRIPETKLIHRFKCKDGNTKWINWNCQFVKEKGTYIVTGKDITELKLAEERNEIFEKALQVESIKNEFFANISHEFKTPLNIILITIQLINTYIQDNKITVCEGIDINKYTKSIRQNSYRLLRLVNNLIDMTKIDSGYYMINLENHNIVNIVEDITISVAEYVENKGIELIFDTDIEEMIIACDPDKIERVMLNLLSNAVKYTEENGRIEVNLSLDNDDIKVSVKDTGIGIPKEKISVIFNRFIQIDSTLARKCEGSGIGLSLVKSLIEMHGGEITVESEEGKGSEFIFKLPISKVEDNLENSIVYDSAINNVEKCNIEFSDIYDVQ